MKIKWKYIGPKSHYPFDKGFIIALEPGDSFSVGGKNFLNPAYWTPKQDWVIMPLLNLPDWW